MKPIPHGGDTAMLQVIVSMAYYTELIIELAKIVPFDTQTKSLRA
jgi:hypothetical protein